jgi:hypothetical protein
MNIDQLIIISGILSEIPVFPGNVALQATTNLLKNVLLDQNNELMNER